MFQSKSCNIFFFFILYALNFFPIQPIHASSQNALLLKDNLKSAKAGDFLVTAQGKNYTVLIIRGLDGEQIKIEEITIPSTKIAKTQGYNWRKWIEEGAKGNTCWIFYNIHLNSGAITQAFSYSRNEWITIPQSQNILSTLLNLTLAKIPDSERKRVGPPPHNDSQDRRPLWQPNLIVDGKTLPGITFEAWRTYWPKDGSDLSGKLIEIYLPQDSSKYPSYFPYWLQVSGLIGKGKIRIVDSGSGLRLSNDPQKN